MNSQNIIKNTPEIFVFLISFVSLFLVLLFFGGQFITGDDIWGATAVLGNPIEVIIFTLRWDLHPPLYYLFLDIWALVSKSDIWIKTNSVVLHALITTLVFHITNKRAGFQAAAIAALLTLSSPLLLEYSLRVRMYSFIAFLSLLNFWTISRYVETANSKYLKWIFLIGFVMANSHAIGILFVFLHFCYGCFYVYKDRSKAIIWTGIHALIALLAIPTIINSYFKSVSHASEPSVDTVIYLLKSLFISGPDVLIIVSFLFLILVLTCKESIKIALCYLVLPVLLFSLISYLLKPLWLDRNFISTLPIVYIAIGLALHNIRIAYPFKLGAVILILVVNISNWGVFKTPDTFKQMVTVIEKEIVDTDGKICVVSQGRLNSFWSLQRYINGPIWGNPIEVQPPINETWQSIAYKLPSVGIELLALNHHPNFTDSGKIILSSGYTARCDDKDIVKILAIGDETFIQGSHLIFDVNGLSLYKK